MQNKKYYVVYWSPVQMGSTIHSGGHPLIPENYKRIVTDIARSINLANAANGFILPKEAICLTWVTEMPSEPVLEPEFLPKMPKKLEEMIQTPIN